ncbi:right-handed parallel beta-helix repeat-containing protein [Parablastomonas sp. CN1-191]|uniref:right-handed parallel beta-helix repeat-containing protein n=1 Tax=Parablastomonas sp. CN1-191 TaxID=3400908 RepID=UPI003BF8E924
MQHLGLPYSRGSLVGKRAAGLLAVAALCIGARDAARSETTGRVFYVSESAGNDAWPGMSAERPWQSLARVNRENFRPGDQILFKAGDRFRGQLSLRSSGNPGQPLMVASYGTGARPLIDGAGDPDGAYEAAILVRNQHDIEFRGLEVTNAIEVLRPGQAADTAAGLLFVDDGAGVLSHIVLSDLSVHDVFAKAIAHRTEDEFNRVTVSAIRFVTTDKQSRSQPSYFRGIRITGNRIADTGRFGVQIGDAGPRGAGNGNAHGRDPETGFNRDIVIAGNRFFELGGSAVQLAGASHALIENNDFDFSGSSARPDRMVGRGSGAWVVNSRDIVAQRNRSRHVRGYKDSYGMHVDFGNLNVLYQYNYSEDSEGGFVEILGNNRNIIWRYNVSVNDGHREKEGNTLWFSSWSPRRTPSTGIFIYNNTVFLRPGLYPDLSFTVADARIWNNIFAVSHDAMIGEEMKLDLRGGTLDVRNNLFQGHVNSAFAAMGSGNRTGDPRFTAAGLTAPAGYRLARGSPAIGAGTPPPPPSFPAAGKGIFAGISAAAKTDFFGTPLPADGTVNIGAYGGTGE